MIADPQNNNKICGAAGSSMRVFDLRGESATESKCKEECMNNYLCVAFSGEWTKWCIGCKLEFNNQAMVIPVHPGAIAYKKRKRPGIFITDLFYNSYKITLYTQICTKFLI